MLNGALHYLKAEIRPAENFDSEDIQEILKVNGLYVEGMNWSKIYPYWFVAEYDDQIVGCIQAVVAQPYGYLNDWAVLPKYKNHGIGWALLRTAEKSLAKAGVKHIYTAINPESYGKWERHYAKHGALDIGEFRLLIKTVEP